MQLALVRQNVSIPGGSVESGPKQFTLRIEGRVPTVESLGDVVIRQQQGHAIRVRDVARVEDGEEDETTWASEDGEQTLLLSVRKQSGENTVAVVDRIKDKLEDISGALPPGIVLRLARDNSEVIRTSVDAVKEHLVLGAVFAALVVLVFLGNFGSTFIAAVAIPISIIGTFALMWAMDFSLNILTLLALALAVGIVIDDAIVVLENIFRFIEVLKKKPFVATVLATRDIGLAVVATTLSLLAVFLPVAFMGGIVGRFLNSFGLTMAFAIAVSLVVSFSITPMLAARWLQPPAVGHEEKSWLERFVDVFYLPIERAYMVMLRFAMAHRFLVMVCCVLTLGATVPLFKAVPKGFLPINDEANFQVDIRALEGTSLQATQLIAERIARDVRRLPGVAYTLATIGDNDQKTPNLASIYVKLLDPKDRVESQEKILARARRDIAAKQPKELKIDLLEVSAFNSGSSNKPVQYSITGSDLARLAHISDNVVEKFRQAPGAADVSTSFVAGKMEVRLTVLRDKAADLGVQVADIANATQLVVGGLKVSTYEEQGEDYDIRIRAQANDRAEVDRLKLMT
ncbi:MAG: efflux RND transporter permease subunit, partial [Oxalobacteraceae bacterium]